jgi:hypothetical protein
MQKSTGLIRDTISLIIFMAAMLSIYAVFGDYVPSSDVEKEFIAYEATSN